MSSPPNAEAEHPKSTTESADAAGSRGEGNDGRKQDTGGSAPDGDSNESPSRWGADVSLALRRIRRSLADSTAPCNEVVISRGGEETVCANCPAGYASCADAASPGVWKVWYRPLPLSLSRLTLPSSPEQQSCPADPGVRLVARLKPRNAPAVETEETLLFPPAEMVKAVLRQMELRDVIAASCSSQESDGNVVHLRDGDGINLAPALDFICPHGINLIPAMLSQYLKPEQLSKKDDTWTALFLNKRNNTSVTDDVTVHLPNLRAFVMDCLVPVSETSPSAGNTEDNAASIVSVGTPRLNQSRQNDGFPSASSLGDVSSHTADTNIGTDEESRLTDDAPKEPLLGCLESTVENQPPRKKRKTVRKEIENLQDSQGRVAAPDRKIIQLFASEFVPGREEAKTQQGRPKRKIKHVVRFDAHAHSYTLEKKKMAAAGKTGSGFLCPQCSQHCSYDVRRCLNCSLPCRYVAGTGVVVEREREEVAKEPPPDIKGDMNFFEKKTSGGKRKADADATAAEHAGENEDGGEQKPKACASIQTNEKSSPSPLAAHTASSVPDPPSSTTGSSRKGKGIDSLECGVCEVCFQVFGTKYLQTHRKRSHKIQPNMFGCPYCPTHLSSANNREIHIQKKHPGEMINLPEEVLVSSKMLPYLCSICITPFTLMGLRNHMRKHGVQRTIDIEHEFRCVCPFCPSNEKSEPPTFDTAELLDDHIKEDHEGCSLIGMRVKSSGQKKARRETSRKEAPEHQVDDAAAAVHDSSALEENTSTSTEEGIWWTGLWHHNAVSQVRDLDTDLSSPNIPFDSAATVIAKGLSKAQKQMARSKMSEEDRRREKDCVEEGRLFLRGVRDRQGKSDSERLEKEKYKQQLEERLIRWRYENRGRPKKTAAEKAEHALVSRPIHFEQQNKNGRQAGENECCVGADCPLCSGDYAKCIITDEEMKKAHFDVLQAIPLPVHQKSEKIMSPSFRELSKDHEYESDDEGTPRTNGQGQGQNATAKEKKLTRSAEKWKNASEVARRLSKAKISLEFIRQYNAGLLEPAPRSKRGGS